MRATLRFFKNFFLSLLKINETTVIDMDTGNVVQRIPTPFTDCVRKTVSKFRSGKWKFIKGKSLAVANLIISAFRLNETTVIDMDTGKIVKRIKHT